VALRLASLTFALPPRGRILRGGTRVLYTTAAGIQANRRILPSRITEFTLGVVAGKGEPGLSLERSIPTALDTWAVQGHMGSRDDGPVDQNGAKSERSGEIFPLGQKCPFTFPSSLLFAYRGAVSIIRGGMETAGKTTHPQPRQQHARRIHDRTER
jgi:hypothetical protein